MNGGASTADAEVWVATAAGDVRAGTLQGRREGDTDSATFSYDDGYLQHGDAYSIDPVLPLRQGRFATLPGHSLFGALLDCSPDGWGRGLVEKEEQSRADMEGRSAQPLGEVDLLLKVRDDAREGALRFRGDSGPFLATDTAGVPRLAELPELVDLAFHAGDGTADVDQLRRLLRASGSLGGARPKVHVVDVEGHLAIAKFPDEHADRWNLMAWEKVTLDLARAAGIVVADSRLLRAAGRHVLVVHRFDRRGEQRVGYASAKTMLKAAVGERRSYLDIADVTEQRSAQPTQDLQQLWRRIVFTVLVSNTDDHLRNHGFLYDRGERWRLSPAFDVNPNPSPEPLELNTAIDETDTSPSITTARAVAERFRVSSAEASQVVAQVLTAVQTWDQVARRHGLAESEIEQMRPAFEHGQTAVARRLASATE